MSRKVLAMAGLAACLLAPERARAGDRPQMLFSLPSSRVCRDADSLDVDLVVRNNTTSSMTLDWSRLQLTAAFTALLDTEHMVPMHSGASLADRNLLQLPSTPFTLQPGASVVRTLMLPMDHDFFKSSGFYRGMPLVSWNGNRAIGDFLIEVRDCGKTE